MIDGPPIHLSADDMVDEPQPRGLAVLYRRDVATYCPGCGRSNWLVGRTSAECAFCSTAIPIHPAAARPPVKA
jgi:hypothetical protein